MKKRIFIAINFPQGIKSKVKSTIEKLEKVSSGVKWINSEGAHITIAFLDWLVQEEIAKVTAVLKIVANNQKKFEVGLENIGFFPTPNSPQVVWIGSRENLNMVNLQNNLSRQLKLSGFKIEKRAFVPHLTIGRVKNGAKNMDKVARKASEINLGKFLVSSVDVMESIFKKEGSEYKTIFRVNFRNS